MIIPLKTKYVVIILVVDFFKIALIPRPIKKKVKITIIIIGADIKPICKYKLYKDYIYKNKLNINF